MRDTVAMTADSILHGAHSDIGQRDAQEDRHEVCQFRTGDGLSALLAMVADGIGGVTTGERASFLAAQIIPALLKTLAPTASEIPGTLVEAFKEANRRIYAEASSDKRRAGMGTTCTAIVIVGRRLYLAHVGDSRAYLVRGNAIEQLSIDHTWMEKALQAGRSPEELRNHPNRGVIERYLGIDPDMRMDTRYRPFGTGAARTFADSASQPVFLEDGDSLLLCSDGVSDNLDNCQLLQIVRRQRAPQAARAVVEKALKQAHAKARSDASLRADNLTAVVIDMPGAQKAGAIPKWAALVAGALILLGVGGGAAWAALGPFMQSAGDTPAVAPTAAAQTSNGTPWLQAATQPQAAFTPSPGLAGEPTATLMSTFTPVPPTPTSTATSTPTPTHTPRPSDTPEPRPTSPPGKTPRPPTKVPPTQPPPPPTQPPPPTTQPPPPTTQPTPEEPKKPHN